MDKEYRDFIEGIDLRIIGKSNTQPETIVVTGSKSASLDSWDVQDITTAFASLNKSANGELKVFVQQLNGKFDKFPMEIYRESSRPMTRLNGEVSKEISIQEVNENISQIREKFSEMNAPKSGDEIRKEYLNKP